ncbi:MAG TPA: hypothetical protein ENH62_16940 [Marinobacter sp.]|uniref:Holin of 3TMs, for gene-transfer release n=1 Tax=marine sediment metagenome TaxID=412755 RepID=A0A0F9M3J8_9ZZZZ|nr:hypothetical protein [Marinobacter sp.]
MFDKLLGFLGSGPAEQIADYFKQKAQLKQQLRLAKLNGKIAFQTAKYQAKAQGQANVHSWEMAQIANSGIKDEIVLGVLLFPYIGSFIPGIQDYVVIGFEYLEKMPYWAVGLTVTIMLAVYGIRHKNASRLAAPGLTDKDVEEVKK